MSTKMRPFALSSINFTDTPFTGYVGARKHIKTEDRLVLCAIVYCTAAVDKAIRGECDGTVTLTDGTVGKLYTVQDADGDNWSCVVLNYNGETYVTGGLDWFVREFEQYDFENLVDSTPTIETTPAKLAESYQHLL